MSKYDYSEYKCEIGDKVWIYDAGSGARVKGVIEATEQVTRKLITPRGKTKRKLLKRTKQGKWAEVFEVGGYAVIKPDAECAYSGSELVWEIISTDQTGFDAKHPQIVGLVCGTLKNHTKHEHIRHATPEEIAKATKPVNVWEGAKYGIVINTDKDLEYQGCHRVAGHIFPVKYAQGEAVYSSTYAWIHWVRNCKPITPAEMTREQLLSIVEGWIDG